MSNHLNANNNLVGCPGNHHGKRDRLVWNLGVHWFVSRFGCEIRSMLSPSLHLTGRTNGDFYRDDLDFLICMALDIRMRRLPPLKSLQAFEAAARWLSFSKAAEELFVTPAAISQQIKQLETYLGTPLFHRMTRAVQLTEEARTVLPLMTEGFDRLAEAVERLAREEETGLLTVSSVPTFAIKWLVHQLTDFSDKYPDIDVRLDASLETRDFQRDGIDVSIRLGMGDYPGLHVTRIFGEEVSPVCSPKLMSGANPLHSFEDLKNHRLLHVDWGALASQSPDWRMWAKAAGIDDIDVNRGPRFTVESMAVEAAINGDGVALVSHSAVVEDLKAGRLVRPFNLVVHSDIAYWLVCPHSHMRRAKVAVFCEWLLAEASTDSLKGTSVAQLPAEPVEPQ